jgi:predicted nucleic acid-binding protein
MEQLKMINSLFLDTSYVLAILNTRDTLHQQALDLASKLDSQLITTEAILTEIGNALAKPQSRKLAINTLHNLRNDETVKIIPVDTNLFAKALQLYTSRPDKDWGLTDCISFIVMQEYKLIHALTADHHFEQTGFQILLTY